MKDCILAAELIEFLEIGKADSKTLIDLIGTSINYYSSTFLYFKNHVKTHKFCKLSRKRILFEIHEENKHARFVTQINFYVIHNVFHPGIIGSE